MTLLTVKNITGDNINIEFPSDGTGMVYNLKKLISEKINSSPFFLRLLYNAVELNDNDLVPQVENGDNFFYLIKLDKRRAFSEFLEQLADNGYISNHSNIDNGKYIQLEARYKKSLPIHFLYDLVKNINILEDLQIFRLNNIKLNGPIPTNLLKFKNLKQLVLTENSLSGEIPKTICNLVTLELIYLTNNNLTGKIPENIGNLVNLKRLCINDNNLSGEIPKSIGKLHKLEYLFLENNNFSGKIPESILNINSLQILLLYNNNFESTFPKNIQKMSGLYQLYLDNDLINDNHIEKLKPLHNFCILYLNYHKYHPDTIKIYDESMFMYGNNYEKLNNELDGIGKFYEFY